MDEDKIKKKNEDEKKESCSSADDGLRQKANDGTDEAKGGEKECHLVMDEAELVDFMTEVIHTRLDDMLAEEEEAQNHAELLLGGCLDLVCTYPEGYKFRQPLYSCKTCFEVTGKLAGVCYACCENCHDGHELVELYTKRNFCCDCGNSKFASKCKLYEEKDPVNKRNKYNDNFKGIFCVCKKPYPPDGNDVDSCTEDMIQCCMCEDWFHSSHIFSSEKKAPEGGEDIIPDEAEELVCKWCVDKHPFLALYPTEKGESQRESEENKQLGKEKTVCKLEAFKAANGVVKNDGKELEKEGTTNGRNGSFWTWAGWRSRLCKCTKCMNLYEDLDCGFLMNREDTISHFEQLGRKKATESAVQNEKPADQSKDRHIAMFVAEGFVEMKKHCTEFFAKRSAQKRVIEREDVEQCFEELDAKRQKWLEQKMREKEEEDNGAWTQ